MEEEKTRVDFNAPASLLERVDGVVEVLDISRTCLLITALEDKLEELVHDEEFRHRLGDAYYNDGMDCETVKAILGREEALRMKLLRQSIDRTPPEPQLDGELPSDEEFYEDDVSVWVPSDQAESDDERLTQE